MQTWPLFVLTLRGDCQRRTPLLNTLKRLGLTYELFYGVDGRSGLSSAWERQINRSKARRNFGRELTDGEFACALSHRELYKCIITRGLTGGIILEDDAIVDQAFANFVKQAHYHHAKLMLLDHAQARVLDVGLEIMPGTMIRRLALPAYLTTGYTASREAAQLLLEASTPVCHTADWPGDIVAMGAVALDPRIVDHPNQENGPSHLRTERESCRSKSRDVSYTLRKRFHPKHRKSRKVKKTATLIS